MKNLINQLTIKYINDIQDKDFCFEDCLKKAQSGDSNASNQLLAHNYKLVAKLAYKYAKVFEIDVNELFSVGCFGFVKAIKNFDLSKGARFSTYASTCTVREMFNYINNDKIHNSMYTTLDDLAIKMGLVDSDGKTALSDLLLPAEEDIANTYEKKMIMIECREYLQKNLKPIYYQVADLYFGFSNGCPMEQIEITKIFGISRAYCSLIIKKTSKLLADHFAGTLDKDLALTEF